MKSVASFYFCDAMSNVGHENLVGFFFFQNHLQNDFVFCILFHPVSLFSPEPHHEFSEIVDDLSDGDLERAVNCV